MGKIDRNVRLTNRKRMIRTCLNEDIDRLPFWFMFGPWGETIARGQSEGLSVGYEEWCSQMGFDAGFRQLPVNLGFLPCFEYIIIMFILWNA